MYFEALGVTKDEAKAVEFYQKSCDGGNNTSCDFLESLGEDLGATKDEAKAAEEGLSYYETGKEHFEAEDYEKAVELFQKSCDGGYADGCHVLGKMYSRGIGGVTKDEAKALEFFQKSCDGGNIETGNAEACSSLSARMSCDELRSYCSDSDECSHLGTEMGQDCVDFCVENINRECETCYKIVSACYEACPPIDIDPMCVVDCAYAHDCVNFN